jgi:hypothetical protein
MNQSDIRGLSLKAEPTLIFSVVSHAFYYREFSSNAAYRIGCSQITLYRACICLCHPYLQSTTLRRRADKRKKYLTYYQAAFFVFLNSYSLKTDHKNPASSLATAVIALQGILPRFTRYQYRLRSRCPALSVISITHWG